MFIRISMRHISCAVNLPSHRHMGDVMGSRGDVMGQKDDVMGL